MNIMAIEADFPIRKWGDEQNFTFQKDEQNHGRGRSIFWKKFFQKLAGHVKKKISSEKKGTLGSSLTTTPSWGPRGRVRVGTGGVWRCMEVI